MRARAWWLFLVAMTPIVGLYLFGPAVFNQGPVFNAIGAAGVVAILVGVRLSVRTSRSNGSAVLEVEDTGMGVPDGDQEHLFDRFFRTQAAEENAIQGSGLGLAISQAIAQAHGGLIEVSSKENAGTTFRLVFPATR
jgi:signal transduction histidine kinase